MKTGALILFAILLIDAFIPAIAQAATELQRGEVGPVSLTLDAYVLVSYRDGKRRERTARGWIDDIGELAFTIRYGDRKTTLNYRDVSSLVISRNAKSSSQRMIEVESYVRGLQQRDPAVDVAIQSIHAKVVSVTLGNELDPEELAPGLYAYVVFNSRGMENAAMGRIVSRDPDRVVIAAGEGRGWEIALHDIVVLAVSDNPGGIELWRMARRKMLKVQETAMTVLSGENLDLEKLRIGWHAHVDYRSSGIKRSATGVIIRRDAKHIVIRPRKRLVVRWTIRTDDVERILVTRNRGDMRRWRRAREAMRELQGPRVRLKAPSISTEWITGRFADSNGDTLEVLAERGRVRVRRELIHDFEVSMGRHRHTKKGLAIGLLLGAAAAKLSKPSDATDADLRGQENLIDAYVTLIGVPAMTLAGTLIGAVIETEKWVEVSPSRVNLSIAPTRDKGLRAAVSFNF